MDSSLSPREIQARIRGGATLEQVATEAGVDSSRLAGFALPVIAEREHMATLAQRSSVRRRGDGTGHRRLGDIIADRLQARGMDADDLVWDAWRQADLLWCVTARLDHPTAPRNAEFRFDPKGRFSLTQNADASWLIGERTPETPEVENTLDDQLAIVRAVQEPRDEGREGVVEPVAEVPQQDGLYEDAPRTSELDELYDMLSGISEDSVRIYLGFEDEVSPAPALPPSKEPDGPDDDAASDETSDHSAPSGRAALQPPAALPPPDGGLDRDDAASADPPAGAAPEPPARDEAHVETVVPGPSEQEQHPEASGADPIGPSGPEAVEVSIGGPQQPPVMDEEPEERDQEPVASEPAAPADASVLPQPDASVLPQPGQPTQDALVGGEEPAAQPRPKPNRRRRAKVPSWDEIMFGGPTPT